MKILFISYAFHPKVGGIESSALMLLREFQVRGHNAKVITTARLDDAAELKWPLTYREPSLLLQWKLSQWADIVYHHNPAFTYWLPSLASRPTVFSIRTWVSRTDRSMTMKDRLKQQVLARFPCIANSHATAAHLAGQSTVIENAYDDEVFFSERPWEARSGAAFVGRLVSDKGVPTALKAIAQVKTSGISIPLRIIGSGPDQTALREQAVRLDIEDQISFLGKLKPAQVAMELNKVKYLLVPSKWEEPFGIVALEGIACGCIPLGTNQGGLVDAIGKCGPLFEKDNASQLADLLIRLETEADLLRCYQQHHDAHLEAHSPRVVAERYLKVFEKAHTQGR